MSDLLHGQSESQTVTVTVLRQDALAVVLGPLDYTIKAAKGDVPPNGSPMRLRQTLAKALEEQS